MTYRGTEPLHIPPEFWAYDDVDRAVRRGSFKDLFRLVGYHTSASQTKIGSAVGLSQTRVSQIANGKHTPRNLDEVEAIATGFGMPDSARMAFRLAPVNQPAAAAAVPAGQVGVSDEPRTMLEHLIRHVRNQTYAEAAKDLGISARHLGRLARREREADPEELHPTTRRALVETFGLALEVLLGPWLSSAESTTTPESLDSLLPDRTVAQAQDSPLGSDDWPIWFGTQVAQMAAVVNDWDLDGELPTALQHLLHQGAAVFDAVSWDDPTPAVVISRRQALATLAAMPMAAGTGATPAGRDIDLFVARAAGSLTACWHLIQGNDLTTVSTAVGSYVSRLEAIARMRSAKRPAAALLASQAHRLLGIVALHRQMINLREQHCHQAIHFARVSGDASTVIAALISLASTFYYRNQPADAARVFEEALRIQFDVPPLQRSRVNAELAVVYAQLGRDRESLESGASAVALYPSNPTEDPSSVYAEFTPASLALERGIACLELANRTDSRGYSRQAVEILEAALDAPAQPVPHRIRFEIVSHQARAAVLLRDLESFERHINDGIRGMESLPSAQRQRELVAAWRLAQEAWPSERRIVHIARAIESTTPR
jgi:transcriptional regulator with XRE-family HTH domain/tetratricopeptide (TPR) repeat protein